MKAGRRDDVRAAQNRSVEVFQQRGWENGSCVEGSSFTTEKVLKMLRFQKSE
jgi:hypothetical protein